MIPYQTDPESIEKAKKRILLILKQYKASRKSSCKIKNQEILNAQLKTPKEEKQNSEMTEKSPLLKSKSQEQQQSTKNITFKPKCPNETQSQSIRAPRNKTKKGSDQNNQRDAQICNKQNLPLLSKHTKSYRRNKRRKNTLHAKPNQTTPNSTQSIKNDQININPIPLPNFSFDDDENLPIINDLPVEKPFISRLSFNFLKTYPNKNLTLDVNNPIYSSTSCNVFISKDDSSPSVYYAIKSSSYISRLKHEYDVYKLINNHPSIITCYDIWFDEEKAFLQLELSEKGSIRSNLFSFTNDQIWQIFSHIIFALKKLHSIGFIHLDISPSNILQCSSFDGSFDIYKLSDFGTSIPIGSFDENCGGAGPYLSPEALLFPDTDFEVGPKADIFSFGVLMMEIVSKKLAPRNCSNYEALRNGSFDFSILNIPDEFSFIKSMLDPNPTIRPSAEQLSLMMPVKKEIDRLSSNKSKLLESRNLEQSPMKKIKPQPSMKQIITRSSTEQITSQSSTAQITPKISTEQITPQISTEQITSQSSTEQITSQSSTEQITPQISTEQITSQSSTEQITSQSSTEQITSQSSTEQILQQSSNVQIIPQSPMKKKLIPSLMKQITPQISTEQITPQSSTAQITPQSSTEQILQQSSNVKIIPKSPMKKKLPSSLMKQIIPQSSTEIMPQSSMKQILPQSTTAQILPQTPMKNKLPRSLMNQISPQSPIKKNCRQIQRKLDLNDSFDDFLTSNKNDSDIYMSVEVERLKKLLFESEERLSKLSNENKELKKSLAQCETERDNWKHKYLVSQTID